MPRRHLESIWLLKLSIWKLLGICLLSLGFRIQSIAGTWSCQAFVPLCFPLHRERTHVHNDWRGDAFQQQIRVSSNNAYRPTTRSPAEHSYSSSLGWLIYEESKRPGLWFMILLAFASARSRSNQVAVIWTKPTLSIWEMDFMDKIRLFN